MLIYQGFIFFSFDKQISFQWDWRFCTGKTPNLSGAVMAKLVVHKASIKRVVSSILRGGSCFLENDGSHCLQQKQSFKFSFQIKYDFLMEINWFCKSVTN